VFDDTKEQALGLRTKWNRPWGRMYRWRGCFGGL